LRCCWLIAAGCARKKQLVFVRNAASLYKHLTGFAQNVGPRQFEPVFV